MTGEHVGRIAAYKFFDAKQEANERTNFGVVSVTAEPPVGENFTFDDGENFTFDDGENFTFTE